MVNFDKIYQKVTRQWRRPSRIGTLGFGHFKTYGEIKEV